MNEPLRHCPTCGGDIEPQSLGLRDYRWIAPSLPGRVAPMDIDFMMERNGHILIHEYKPKGAALGLGQRLTLKALARLPDVEVWVVWEDPDGKHVEVGEMDKRGNVKFVERMMIRKFAHRITDWFRQMSEEER